MSISTENVSREILQIMKGNGLSVTSFDSDLRPTIKSQESRWFYNKELGIMIHLTDDKSKPELKIMMSQGLDTDRIKDMYMALRTVARNYNLLPTVRIFGKHIEPKDFSGTVASISESSYGSTRTSYHPTVTAKVVLRHTKPVAEDRPGSRSRNIKQIYIDNNQGERFKFEAPYLTGARAMARHVSDGGNPYDERGRTISDMAMERQNLRKMISYAKKRLVMDGLDEEIGLALGRIDEIGKALKRFHRTGELNEHPTPAVDVSEQSKIKFTVQEFDTGLAPALKAIEQQRHRVKETLAARHSVDMFESAVAKYDGTMKKLKFDYFEKLEPKEKFLRESGLKASYDLVMVRAHHLAETHMRRMDSALQLANAKFTVPNDRSKPSLQEDAFNSILFKISNINDQI
jgi:hypothetical protein